MARSLLHLPALDNETGLLNVVVDTPKGSRNKYTYDRDCAQWHLSKILPLGASFPFDFGFIPSTRAEDGDALDVLVLIDEPAFPGCVVSARLIGVLEAEQTEDGATIRNDRLVAVVETPYNMPEFKHINELSTHRLDEIEHFFISYNQMEGRQFRPLGREGPARARELLEEAMEAARSQAANGAAAKK